MAREACAVARRGPGAVIAGRRLLPYLRRFLDASTYISGAIVHAGVAGPRALQMLRSNKYQARDLK